MNILVLGNRVLIKPIEAETKKISGEAAAFEVAGKAQNEPERGIVVGVGALKVELGTIPEVGDEVLYEPGQYRQIMLEGVKHLIVSGDSLIGVSKAQN